MMHVLQTVYKYLLYDIIITLKNCNIYLCMYVILEKKITLHIMYMYICLYKIIMLTCAPWNKQNFKVIACKQMKYYALS